MPWKLHLGFIFTISAIVSLGCGSSSEFAGETGMVTGTITLDGNPLTEAEVTFRPMAEDAGGSSSGITNEDGTYELFILPNEPGAWLGEHQVSIVKESVDEENEISLQVVPPRYNVNTELTATVEEGENVRDFQLDSSGYQPAPPREPGTRGGNTRY